jgi:hypothetical protein
MSDSASLKRFTISLDAGDYEALCALAQAQRPPLSLRYTVRLAIRRFLDEHEGRAITLVPTSQLARRIKR